MAQISLKNFRKFESLNSLTLNDMNIFVGKNNAGKSTVVKAIMLTLDNLRNLNWVNINPEEGFQSMKDAPTPIFRFDANGFHNLHIGTFERAKCNYIDDRTMVLSIEYGGVNFEITISGIMGDGQVSMPIENLKISFPKHSDYAFNFTQKTMAFTKLTPVESELDIKYDPREDLERIESDIKKTEAEIKECASKGEALKIAELQDVLKKLRLTRNKIVHEIDSIDNSAESKTAIFDLAYFHDNASENILVQYIKTFAKLADRSSKFQTLGTGSMFNAPKEFDKRSKAYREEYANRELIEESRDIIASAASKLDQVLNSINIDYIQAHAATQKLILSTDDKQDINSRVVHEFYQENIQAGDEIDRFIKKWLASFEIGDSIRIKPLEGEGYYVMVESETEETHLADMGMGSIQLVILLLRLATIAKRTRSSHQQYWVIIEEPEQNIHPLLQSKLADLFKEFADSFNVLLIIETHSEYLIRKTQLMLAEDNYSEKDIKDGHWSITVFYFPANNGEQPYDMEYQPNGRFKRSFGKGFYDTAGSLAIELSNFEQKDDSSLDINWGNF